MAPMDSSGFNPCLECGACCAFYRASFYWAECDDVRENGVPAGYTEQLTPFRVVMKGTNSCSPRCLALKGVIGLRVHCVIYDRRASVCRDFAPSWLDDNILNERCDKARRFWGLAPLTPGFRPHYDDYPQAA